MRHTIIIHASLPLLALLLPAVMMPGCNTSLDKDCSFAGAGYTVYLCTYSDTMNKCGAPVNETRMSTCATGQAEAEQQIKNFTGGKFLWYLVCTGTGKVVYQANSEAESPKIMPQGLCDVSMSDDTCLSCLKSSCCGDVGACLADANCLCYVNCKAMGNTDADCALPALCGTESSVTASASACLDAHCAGLCGSMAAMGGMCPDMTSTGSGTGSSSSGTTTSCTGGAGLPNDPCANDESCQSCNCDTQTMICY